MSIEDRVFLTFWLIMIWFKLGDIAKAIRDRGKE